MAQLLPLEAGTLSSQFSTKAYKEVTSLHKIYNYWLKVSQQGVKQQTFWQLDLERRLHLRRDEDYVEAFDELFTRAVQSRLRSLYPIGVSMSGGLDSSAVAVTAARLLAEQGQTLTAYTEVPRAGFAGPLPPGKYADETPFVQAIAAMTPNLQLQLVRTTGQSLFADLDQFFAAMYGPFQNVSNRLWMEAIQAQAQAQGVRVLLSGASGNLTVSWSGISPLPRQVQVAVHHLRQRDVRALFTTQPLPTALHSRLIRAKHKQY